MLVSFRSPQHRQISPFPGHLPAGLYLLGAERATRSMWQLPTTLMGMYLSASQDYPPALRRLLRPVHCSVSDHPRFLSLLRVQLLRAITFTITATSGGLTHSTQVTLVVADFSISVSPGSQTVRRGSKTSYTVTIAPLGPFSSTVSFTASGLPKRTNASFNPTSVSGARTSTFTISANTHSANVRLRIQQGNHPARLEICNQQGCFLLYPDRIVLAHSPSGIAFRWHPVRKTCGGCQGHLVGDFVFKTFQCRCHSRSRWRSMQMRAGALSVPQASSQIASKVRSRKSRLRDRRLFSPAATKRATRTGHARCFRDSAALYLILNGSATGKCETDDGAGDLAQR